MPLTALHLITDPAVYEAVCDEEIKWSENAPLRGGEKKVSGTVSSLLRGGGGDEFFGADGFLPLGCYNVGFIFRYLRVTQR